MKKLLFTIVICLFAAKSFADSVFIEGFEYGNHDMTVPVGWTSDGNSWLSGYLDKDHNRIAHTGNWYAFTEATDSWMFTELYMSDELKYRYHFWGISDGTYDVEFWAGSGPSTSQMATLLFTKTVSSGEYERFSEYIETIAADYQYFGIHAIAHEGAYCLTIDDILVDMVGKYDLEVNPDRIDTYMMPGEQITIEYDVQNTGYEDLHIYMTPYTDFFSDISFTEDGFNYSSFPTVANQVVHCTCTATLNPDVELGTTCFMDIMFTVSCDCVTRMATLWVTVLDPAETADYTKTTAIFPNPTNDFASINVQCLQQVTVTDITGKRLITTAAGHDNIRLDLSSLPAGIYFVTTLSAQGQTTQKLIKQ